MASLTLLNIEKSFGASKVIKGVNLDIKDGEFVVFVGPSGCGKSTLLRIIAGLEDATSGTISIGQSVVNDVAPSKRGVSMVFQSYALYPHMTVRQNMAFGLKQVKTPSAIIQEKVQNAADILQLSELLDRYPKNLSGGQRQRVAIGRAIVRDPEVFLFDEPLSNLDADLRGQTRTEIAKLHQDLYATMIYVTHDQIEAMTLADKIVVLRSGQVEQIGSPQELYKAPKNTFVAQFIGSPKMNLFSSKDTVLAPEGKKIGVRPEHMELADKDTSFKGVVDFVEYLGETKLAHCKMDSGTIFTAKISPEHSLLAGENVGFKANTANFHHFDEATGQRLADDKKTSP